MPMESKILLHGVCSAPITLKEGTAAAIGSATRIARRVLSMRTLPAHRVPETQAQIVVIGTARVVLIHRVDAMQPVRRQIDARPHAWKMHFCARTEFKRIGPVFTLHVLHGIYI